MRAYRAFIPVREAANTQARKTASTDSVIASQRLPSGRVINARPRKKQAQAASGIAKSRPLDCHILSRNWDCLRYAIKAPTANESMHPRRVTHRVIVPALVGIQT